MTYIPDHRSTLPTFCEYQPTSMDRRGLGATDDDRDWIVCPVMIQPKIAEIIDESNWSAQLAAIKEADPEGNDHTIHYFGHWTSDFQIAIVRPGSKAHEVAVSLEMRLADYPILDDSDLSERECAAQYESVENALHRLDIERNDESLDNDEISALADEICQAARYLEPFDSSAVKQALTKLGWAECLDFVWRPEDETEVVQ